MVKYLRTRQVSLIVSPRKQTLTLHIFEHLWGQCQGQPRQGQPHQAWGGTTETSANTSEFKSQGGLSEGPSDSEAKCQGLPLHQAVTECWLPWGLSINFEQTSFLSPVVGPEYSQLAVNL